MTTHDDLRRICRELPGAVEGDGEQWGYGVVVRGKSKGFFWTWRERIDPKKARVVNDRVIAIRTPGLEAKEILLQSGHAAIFTEDHYNNYPAILVRLDAIEPAEIEDLIIEGWRTVATREQHAEYAEQLR